MDKNSDIKIYFVTKKNLFTPNLIEDIKQLGEVIFIENVNPSLYLLNDDSRKVIVYDPDFGGWNFPDDIIINTKNILAIFLGTTDKSYINLKICEEKNIKVFNIPKYAGDSVAEYLVMYMFTCAKKIPLQIKNNNKQDFDDIFLQMQLKEKKVGIIGLGNIGTKIADICDGIGMKVYYWNRTKKQTNYEYLTLKKIFANCDVIYLCLQINDETKKLISDELLESIKKDAIFISCTGKQLFNSSIIERKLENEEIFGFALEEPDIALNEYKGNVMVTSEYGWFTKDAAQLRIFKWYELIVDYLCDLQDISNSKFKKLKVKNKNENVICKVRKAVPNDLPIIAKLYKEQNWFGDNNSVEKMQENYNYSSKNNILLVAEYKNRIIGTVTAGINKAYAFNCMNYMVFDYLVVKKEYRRKRVGTQLVNALISLAKCKKMESIWVCSSIGRGKAHKFYNYMGFNDPVKGFRKVFIKE